MIFKGRRGEVRSASGPWRASGDWWEDHPWGRDEWDIEVHFHFSAEQLEKSAASCPHTGIYRVHQDLLRNTWFVQGIYD
jgi:hypothetical protein